MLKEYKEFAMKGNMVDMAIGIIIGAAFGTVVKSLVNDIIMPLISSAFSAPENTANVNMDSMKPFAKRGVSRWDTAYLLIILSPS